MMNRSTRVPRHALMRRVTGVMTAAAVVLTLVVAHPATAPTATAVPQEDLGQIAVVPLDDRPFTSYTPVAVAEAGGHQAVTPPMDMLGDFFTPGDSDAIGAWWQNTARYAEGSVLAVPMLAYGGLVASRACDTSIADARRRLTVFDEVKRANPRQPVYAFDVIMRLTIEPSGGYPGKYSGPIRTWAILMDKVENLGQEELRAEYEQVAASIPAEVKADYLCARARDHQVNREMIHRVAAGTVDYLILGQDDATEFGPHRPEKAALAALVEQLGLQDRVTIYPGADILGALLVAKHVTERLGGAPTVDVEWSRTPGEQWTAPYQDVPYARLVDEYVRTLGGTVVDDPDADILLMANTAGGGSLEPFADRIHAAVARGRMVAVGDDALPGRVDPELRELLAPRIRFGELAAWSGWNIGLTIAQSVVRTTLLEASRSGRLRSGTAAQQTLLQRAATAHTELLLQELAHTDIYRNQVLASVKTYAEQRGDDPQNMTKVFDGANQLAIDTVTPLAGELFAEEFAGSPIRLGSDGNRELTAVVQRLDSWAITLAWKRYQELEIFPTVQLSSRPADRDSLVTVSSLPHAVVIRPQTDVNIPLTVVLRNDLGAPVSANLAAAVPAGWTAPAETTVALAPFEVRAVPIVVDARNVPPDGTETVAVTATHTSPVTQDRELATTATTQVTGRWRNVALESEGSVASASGWWQQYQPRFAIDGNRVSAGSRWITETSAPHWLEVRLARDEPIDTVNLYQYRGYELTDYRISALVSGTWRVLTEVTGNGEATTRHTVTPVRATAVRLDVLGSRDGRARLYELELTCRNTSSSCDG